MNNNKNNKHTHFDPYSYIPHFILTLLVGIFIYLGIKNFAFLLLSIT